MVPEIPVGEPLETKLEEPVAKAAAAIGASEEGMRCTDFLGELSPEAPV